MPYSAPSGLPEARNAWVSLRLARAWLASLLGALGIWVMAMPWCTLAAAAPKEYQAKAVYLYNFAQFAQWPAAAFTNSTAPLVVGVLGVDPFGAFLDDTLKGETVGRRPLIIKRMTADNDLRGIHLLFISQSEKDRVAAVLQKLQGQSVLTVADMEGFAQHGGMICLYMVESQIFFEIKPEVAQRAGIQISSKLLRLSRTAKSKD
jgi:hypothetical protein